MRSTLDARRVAVAAASVIAAVILFPGPAAAEPVDTRQDGFVFRTTLNEPSKGCMWGGIKNENSWTAEISWTYVMTSASGGVSRDGETWILKPGEGHSGWAAIMNCPFNERVGSAASTERMSHVRVENIRFKNLSAGNEEREEQHPHEDGAGRQQESEHRAEQQRNRDSAERQRQLDAHNRNLDRINQKNARRRPLSPKSDRSI